VYCISVSEKSLDAGYCVHFEPRKNIDDYERTRIMFCTREWIPKRYVWHSCVILYCRIHYKRTSTTAKTRFTAFDTRTDERVIQIRIVRKIQYCYEIDKKNNVACYLYGRHETSEKGKKIFRIDLPRCIMQML
jgi:hypothetical protein